jgi:hypothetical protein
MVVKPGPCWVITEGHVSFRGTAVCVAIRLDSATVVEKEATSVLVHFTTVLKIILHVL